MARGPTPGIPSLEDPLALRCVLLLLLPFELGGCAVAELAAKATHLLDSRIEPLEARRCATNVELRSLEPLEALQVALRPFVPAFRRSACEAVCTSREEQWATYDAKAKASVELLRETDWKRVGSSIKAWLRLQWQHARSGELRKRGTSMAGMIWLFFLRPVFNWFRAKVGLTSTQEKLENYLAGVRRECDAGKAKFQAADIEGAAASYTAALDQLLKADAKATSLPGPETRSAAATETMAELATERVRVFVNMALCLKKLERFDEAVDYATQALAVQPEHVKALFLRGGALLAAGRATLAEKDLAIVVAKEPSNAIAKAELQRARAAAGTDNGSGSPAGPATAAVDSVPSEGKGSAGASAADAAEEPSVEPEPLPREALIALLGVAAKVRAIVQDKVSELARKITAMGGGTDLTFVEGHQMILTLNLPKDPLEEHGFTEAALPMLLSGYEEDAEVMACAEALLSPSGKGDPEVAKNMALEDIVEFHKRMVVELRRVLDEFNALPSEQRRTFTGRGCETTAELLVSAVVQHQLALKSEDVEQAVVVREEELQMNFEFMRATEQLASMMQELIGATAPPNLEGMD